MTTLIGIPPNDIGEYWLGIRHLLDSACERSNGKYQAVDILRFLLRGDMQLWGAIKTKGNIEAIAIGEIVNYPRIKMYRLLAATGDDRAEWQQLVEGIEEWAQSVGCLDCEIVARPGWERVLKDRGYRKTHVVLNKTLISGTLQ